MKTFPGGGGGGEKLGIKLKLSFSWGLGLAELGKNRIVETGRVVLIPRISFIPKMNNYPFEWQRRQFPVRPAFAMTINKSQGQTLKHAGVWLRGDVFTHGQLYVACSRVSSPDSLHFALNWDASNPHNTAVNVVFREVLLSK